MLCGALKISNVGRVEYEKVDGETVETTTSKKSRSNYRSLEIPFLANGLTHGRRCA